MTHFVCGDHTEEQYANKKRTHVHKAVVNKVLSSCWFIYVTPLYYKYDFRLY